MKKPIFLFLHAVFLCTNSITSLLQIVLSGAENGAERAKSVAYSSELESEKSEKSAKRKVAEREHNGERAESAAHGPWDAQACCQLS